MNKLALLAKPRTSLNLCYKFASVISEKTQHYQNYTQNSLLLQPKKSPLTILSHERHLSIFIRIKNRLRNFFSDSTKVRIAGCLVYETIGDADYKSFFECFELPDSFQSWFLFIQVHVWMTILVTISERHGREFRNSVVDSMWNDVELRIEKLGNIRSSLRKKYLNELVSQFQGALVGLDEGILQDDTVLASAAWRLLFACKMVDPELLEKFVFYVRRQIAHLDKLPVEKIIFNGSISFLPFDAVFSEIKD